jgi:hypothetical protein
LSARWRSVSALTTARQSCESLAESTRKGLPQSAACSGGTMAISNTEKYKDYAHYAAHCLYLETAANDPDSRAIQHEMAAEWLKLANAVRRRSRPEQMQMK